MKSVNGLTIVFTDHAIVRFKERLNDLRYLKIPWEKIAKRCKGKPVKSVIKVHSDGIVFVCLNCSQHCTIVKTVYGRKTLNFDHRKSRRVIRWP